MKGHEIMSKIKLNLASGVSVEKPLLNAFTVNTNKYLILDNEMNGSMGLPIVLVCKIVDNKVTKILDAAEWNNVKDYLKQIIAGSELEYIPVDPVMSADDIYYTQLTLTVPSFDALKNSYKISNKVEEAPMEVGNVAEPVVPIMDEINNYVQPEVTVNSVPTIEPAPIPTPVESPVPVVEQVINEPTVEPFSVSPQPVSEPVSSTLETPVVESPVATNPVVQESVAPQIEMPTFEMPTAPQTPVVPVETTPLEAPIPLIEPNLPQPIVEPVVEPVVEPAPIQNSTPINEIKTDNTSSIFESQKEAFMEACSNMFDALVQRFEKELQDKNN